MTSSPRARRVAVAAVLVLVLGALVLGILEGGDDVQRPDDVPTLAEARVALSGAPAPLARLYGLRGGVAQAGGPDGVPVLDLGTDGLRRLLRGLRGRPVVVNSWYPGCAPCREEFPVLRAAVARHGREVAFLGLVTQDPLHDVRAFLEREPTAYPHVLDPDAAFTRRELDGGYGFPTTAIIDADGRVAAVHAGAYRSLRPLEEDLRRYAGLRPPPTGGAVRRPSDPAR